MRWVSALEEAGGHGAVSSISGKRHGQRSHMPAAKLSTMFLWRTLGLLAVMGYITLGQSMCFWGVLLLGDSLLAEVLVVQPVGGPVVVLSGFWMMP